MITPDDNGYARVKRWREKNRALNNLRQRNYRKSKKNFPVTKGESSGALAGDAPKSSVSTIAALRALINEPITEPVADSRKPVVYRNDYGSIITAEQWEKLQEKKREAKEKGYVLDEYSQ